MNKFYTSLILLFVFSFGLKSQYQYSTSVTGSNNITMVVTVTSTGINLNQNGGGCVVRVIYDTDVKFFQNGALMTSNYPTIYTLQGTFRCNPPPNGNLKTSFFQISNSVGNTTGNLSSSFAISGSGAVPVCQSLDLDNVMCNEISFHINFPGYNNSNLIVPGTSTLPIELITFDAYKKDRQVEIAWRTASELNNDYFTIERSLDGSAWENIQTIPGAGNSSQITDYSWIDYSPLAGISYYRLKQTDYDGTTEVFNIVSVEQNEVKKIQAYPNPVSHTATLLGVDQNQDLRVFNTVGVEVTGNLEISTSPSGKTFLDMGRLPKGMYYVTNGEQRIQLLKQ